MDRRKKLKKLALKNSHRFEVKEPGQDIDYDQFPPIFSFKNIRYGGDFCITKCSSEDKSVILERLLRISQLTWRKIRSAPKDGLGCERIPSHRFRAALPPVITEEVAILVFRYSGSGRLAGFRDNDIYHIVLVGEDLYSH